MKYSFPSGREAKKDEIIKIKIGYKPCAKERFEKIILVNINKAPGLINFFIKGNAE